MALNPGPARAAIELLLADFVPDRTDEEVRVFFEKLIDRGGSTTTSSLATHRILVPGGLPQFADELIARITARLSLTGAACEVTVRKCDDGSSISLLWYTLPTSKNPRQNIRTLLTLWDQNGVEVIVPKLKRSRAIWNDEWGDGEG